MQNSSDKNQENKDERVNGMEDSPMITIDYLRARLLAERSVSKAAKERADELAKRVIELEEQLKVSTLKRKKAEKATLDILSLLSSRGIGDVSDDAYESESDKDESLCESNVGDHETTKDGCSGFKGNDESSGSDHDSTPSSSKSLSWKGCDKETSQQFDMKSFDSSSRRRASLAHVSSSPRHRLGKSCRQIKCREMRSVVEESRNESIKSDGQDNEVVNSSDSYANHLDTGNEKSEKFHEKRVQNCFQKNEDSLSTPAYARECDASDSDNHECSGDMERALEQQAQLIGCYKAQEKAQRDWEEKYGENNIDTPDSCEPGNHSDVTEERDENKAPVPHSAEIVTGQGVGQNVVMKPQFLDEPSYAHFNSLKINQESHNYGDMKASTSSASDFAFTVVDSNQTQEHGAKLLFQPSTPSSLNLQQYAAPVAESCVRESEHADDRNINSALVPQQESHRLGSVLGALQEAKALLQQQMDSLPATNASVGKALETTPTRDGDWFKVPVECAGLFRVPVDLPSQASQSGLLGSDYSPDLANSFHHSGSSAFRSDQYTSRSQNLRFSHPDVHPFTSMPIISDRQSRYDGFHFNTTQPSSRKSSVPSHSSVPDLFPSLSSNQLSSDMALWEARKHSSGSPYHVHDIRSNMFR